MARRQADVKRPKLDDRGDDSQPVFLDDDGDLSLHVSLEGYTATYVGIEAVGRERLVVELPEDSPDGFKIFLDIIHGRFDQVPGQLWLDQLVDVLITTGKYDATAITRPWARTWFEGVKDGGASGFTLLCAAWELGDVATFEKMVSKVVDGAQCSADESRRLLYDGCYADEIKHLEPPGLFEAIKELRAALVAAHMAPYVEIYKVLTKPGGSESPLCPLTDRRESRTCDYLVLGSLIMGLSRSNVNITAKNPAEEFTGSLQSLKDILQRLRIVTTNHGLSGLCDDDLKDRRKRGTAEEAKIREAHVVIKQEHRDYMMKQANKTGI